MTQASRALSAITAAGGLADLSQERVDIDLRHELVPTRRLSGVTTSHDASPALVRMDSP